MAGSICKKDKYVTFPTKVARYLPKNMNRTIQNSALSPDSSL